MFCRRHLYSSQVCAAFVAVLGILFIVIHSLTGYKDYYLDLSVHVGRQVPTVLTHSDKNADAHQQTLLTDTGVFGCKMSNFGTCPTPTLLPGTKNPYFVVRSNDSCGIHCLPYYIIPGVTKCGTTQLSADVQLHPAVVPVGGEVHWFDSHQSFRSYTDRFGRLATLYKFCIQKGRYPDDISRNVLNPCNIDFESTSSGKYTAVTINASFCTRVFTSYITGEKAPRYIWHGNIGTSPDDFAKQELMIPKYIYKMNPNAKIIPIIRNPVTRTLSEYKYFILCGRKEEDLSNEEFHNFVVGAIDWWKRCISKYPEFRCMYEFELPGLELPGNTRCRWDPNYNAAWRLRISMYYFHLKDFLNVLPRENILIIRSEDYQRDWVTILRDKIFPFLGLKPLSLDQMDDIVSRREIRNVNNRRSDLKGWNKTMDLLRDFFHPYNVRLAKLLQDDRFLWL